MLRVRARLRRGAGTKHSHQTWRAACALTPALLRACTCRYQRIRCLSLRRREKKNIKGVDGGEEGAKGSERRGEARRREAREMYKLSTLSRKMALKLSRACGSTRDSGKLPFIASQTMTVSPRITHRDLRTHTHTHRRVTAPRLITPPAAICMISSCVSASNWHRPRQLHAFMCLISC